MPEKKRLLIIDGNAVVHRAYHALPPLKTRKGELVNACYGFCLVFLKALREIKPQFVAATFDTPAPTLRHKEFKEYKAKRPKAPEELYGQIAKVKKVLQAFNIPVFENEGFEADDLIGTISHLAAKKQVYPRIENVILSGDLDTLQLIDENTKVYTMRKGLKDTVLYDEQAVKEKYQGLTPSQLVDFKGLRGDPSDNIPGVTGIGEKTAIKLLKVFGSLAQLYREIEEESDNSQKKIKPSVLEKLKKYKEQAFFSKKLAEIRNNAPLDFKLEECRLGGIDKRKILDVFEEFEFQTLTGRLDELPGMAFKNPEDEIKKDSTAEEIEKLRREKVFSQEIAELEKNLAPVVKQMEENGIKIDLPALKQLSESLAIRINNLKEEIYKITCWRFNLNSPSQLADVLFEKLKISSQGLKKTPAGAISTNVEELKKVKNSHQIVNLILEYREIFKLKTAFADGLLKLADKKDGKIHPHFHQLGTETGRLSCSEPNLQNIPVKGELAKEIRKCFQPEKGYKFVSVDYSQIELRIAATVAADEKMQEIFQKKGDVHKLTASQIFNIPLEKTTNEMRELAKTLNYGILYGMGAKTLSARAGISREEAEEFIKMYFDKFKKIAEYTEEIKQKTKKEGFSQTLFGRKRFLPEINSIDQRLRGGAERMAVNMPIQGTAADIIKMAMVKIAQTGILDNDCKLVLQIHDELLFEVKEEKIKEKALPIKEIMENIVKLKVPLEVQLKSGKNWGELENVLK